MCYVVMHHIVIRLFNLATFVDSIIDTTPGPDTDGELKQMMVQLLLVE